jgi:hypothetical protein
MLCRVFIVMLSVIMLSVVILKVVNAECHYSECRGSFYKDNWHWESLSLEIVHDRGLGCTCLGFLG